MYFMRVEKTSVIKHVHVNDTENQHVVLNHHSLIPQVFCKQHGLIAFFTLTIGMSWFEF